GSLTGCGRRGPALAAYGLPPSALIVRGLPRPALIVAVHRRPVRCRGAAARPKLGRHNAEELARPRRGANRHRIPQRQLAERRPADVEAPGPLTIVHGDAGDGRVVVIGTAVLQPAGEHLRLEARFGGPGQPGGPAACAPPGGSRRARRPHARDPPPPPAPPARGS